jgi:ribosome biogenesis GTPase
MIDLDFERLRSIGLTPALAQALSQTIAPPLPQPGDDAPAPRPARLVQVHRETLQLHDGSMEHSARPHPALLRALAADHDALAVGDWVLVEADAQGGRWVTARVPPVSHLARRDGDGHRHAVVSNVDTALLVMGLDLDFNLRRLERYLALVHGSGMQPVVVLTKRDVVGPAALPAALDSLRGRMPAHLDVLAVDARSPQAAVALAPYLAAGQTLVLLGSSGAGKSTLTNALMGQAVQDTGAVREHDSRGKHTTTARSLHLLPGGACIIDTPGVRALRPDGDEHSVAAAFEDIALLAAQCRFRDCRHEDEPGCAVRAGVPADRLRNYHKLRREARRDTLSALERREEVAKWKVRHKAAAARMRAKQGGAG